MSDEELVALKQKIERELAERSETSKQIKTRIKKSGFKPPPFEQMSARFCRQCGHPIWETRLSGPSLNHPKPLFYVKGRGDAPKQVAHCPNCGRKLSPGRLRYSDEIEEAFGKSMECSNNISKPDGTILYKYCVECGHEIGLLRNSDPPQFFDKADRQKPIDVCPTCNTPLIETDDVDYSDQQRELLGSVYSKIHRRAQEIRASQHEIDQLIKKIRDKKPVNFEGAKAVIGVHTGAFCKDKTGLQEQFAKCRDYCQRNRVEVVKELEYCYNRSNKSLRVDALTQGDIRVIVATMNWLTSHSHREAVEFVRELDCAGIHLEVIVGEGVDQD
jgi:hypothetical protein